MATLSNISRRLDNIEARERAGPYDDMSDDDLEKALRELNHLILADIGNGDAEAGYSAFRELCDRPTPEALNEFLDMTTTAKGLVYSDGDALGGMLGKFAEMHQRQDSAA